MKFAIIDLGTNSARLFIFECDASGKWNQVLKERIMVRLGDDLFLSGTLSEVAFDRAVKAFERFKFVIDQTDVDSVKVIATSALREAQDSSRLMKKIKELTGLDVEVISGEQEAVYVAQGVLHSVKTPSKVMLIVDIGGGSTELILCSGEEVVSLQSLAVGAGRAQQVYLKTVPPDDSAITKMKEELRTALDRHFSAVGTIDGEVYGVGTSGSVRALGRIAVARGESKDGSFNRQFLAQLIAEVKPLSIEKLRALPQLEERRADLIVAASVILLEVMDYFDVSVMKPVSCSLVNGVLLEVTG